MKDPITCPINEEGTEPKKNQLTPITSSEGFLALVEKSKKEPVIIYKHSSTCPISARAHDVAIEAIETGVITIPVNILTVQGEHELKSHIAEKLQITHESPQLIVIYPDDAKLVLNHREITILAIKQIMSYESTT